MQQHWCKSICASQKRFELLNTLLADWVSIVPNWQKNIQQAFNPNLLGLSDWSLNLKALRTTNIVSAFKSDLCRLHIGQMLRLPWAVSLDGLHNTFPQIMLTVWNTENRATFNLLFLLNLSSIDRRLSQSLETDGRLLLLLAGGTNVVVLVQHY